MAKYSLSSTHVELPKEIIEAFRDKAKEIVPRSQLFDSEGGQGYEDEPHVTVLYGLHDIRPSLGVIDLIQTYPKFTVSLGKVSLFKGDETGKPFDVVKTDIYCPDLHVLNDSISKIAENSNEFPEYIPHATVAYVKKNTCDHLAGYKGFEGLSFPATKVIFSNPDGYKRHLALGVR